MIRVDDNQGGVALVLVLLAMAMLGAVGLGLTLSSTVSRLTTANYDEANALMNAAESALELAAREFAWVDVNEVLAGDRVSPLTDGPPGLRVITAEHTLDLRLLTHQLTCGRTVLCSDAQVRQFTLERPWGVNNPRWRLFIHQFVDVPSLPIPAPPAYVIVWLGDDPREDDGDPARDGAGANQDGRYIVRARAEAFGPRGGRRGIEAELARFCVDGPAGEECAPGSRVQSWRAVSALVP